MVGKNHDFKKIKYPIFYLNRIFYVSQIFYFFVQPSKARDDTVQKLYDDVINDKDYVGFKRVTENRELMKYNRR